MKLYEIVKFLENWANPKLAASWDNVGLLVGNQDNQVSKIMLSLDVTPNAIYKAVKNGVDLIITHHPLIFKPLKKINDPRILELIKNDIAVYTMHTNLDFVQDGVNKILAKKLLLQDLKLIPEKTGSDFYQLSVYVPRETAELLKAALGKANIGTIGNYSECMNYYNVQGQFKPGKNSSPSKGKKNKLSHVEEVKIEFLADDTNLQKAINIIKQEHPYETPVYTITKQVINNPNYGLGYIGKMKKRTSLGKFAELIKNKLGKDTVKLWLADKSIEDKIQKVADRKSVV